MRTVNCDVNRRNKGHLMPLHKKKYMPQKTRWETSFMNTIFTESAHQLKLLLVKARKILILLRKILILVNLYDLV